MIVRSGLTVSSGTHSIVIGAGQPYAYKNTGGASNSSAFSLTAIGGGGGGCRC